MKKLSIIFVKSLKFISLIIVLEIIVIAIGLASCTASPEADISISIDKDVKNLNDLVENGFEKIFEQSIYVELESFGDVKFVSGTNKQQDIYLKLDFYLLDSKDDILYKFPDFYGNIWIFFELRHIAFQDVNLDGDQDIIVIADYMAPAGENAGKPFPVAGVYFQGDKEFISLPEFENNMNDAGQNESFEMTENYTREHIEDIKIEFQKIVSE